MDYQAERSPKMHEIWGAHLKMLGFKPMDNNGAGYWSADGVYYCFAENGREDARDIQLVIIGPMHHTPYELVMLMDKAPHAPASYWVKGIGTIPPAKTAPPALAVILYERGIWNIELRSNAVEFRPGFDPVNPFEEPDIGFDESKHPREKQNDQTPSLSLVR